MTQVKTMTKELFNDIHEFWEKHPFYAGATLGQKYIYWVIVLAAFFTGKKWGLMDKS